MITEKNQRIRYIVGDYLSVSVAWFVFNYIRYKEAVEGAFIPFDSFAEFYRISPVILGQLLFPLLMMGIYYLSGYYNRPLFKSRLEELMTTVYSSVIGSVVIFFCALVDDPIPDKASNLELLGMLCLLLFACVYTVRLSITWFTRRFIHSGTLSHRMMIIGINQDARRLRHNLESIRGRGYKVIGYVDTDLDNSVTPVKNTFDGLPVYSLAQLCENSSDLQLDALLIPECVLRGEKGDFSEILNRLYPLEVPLMISPQSIRKSIQMAQIGDIAGEPLVDITSAKMSEATRNLKRFGDILVSATALLLLSPILLLLSIIIKLDSKGPVFYRQQRIGFHKKPFGIIKFRTMVDNAEQAGPQLSVDGDSRITRVGKVLRKYRFDELPQFWNILKGDMSLVGPRPEREYFIRQIIKKAPYYSLLHQVRPGLTSWGMVKYGYASDVDSMVERSYFDLIYLDNISLGVDLKIMLHTINTVIKGKGV